MSSFDELSSVSYLTEDSFIQYRFVPPESPSPSPIGGKRVRVILGQGASSQLDLAKATARLRKEFKRLCTEWKRETQSVSSLRESAMNASYQRIIGFGPAVMPLIIAEMKREPDWWFWALRAITGVDPVRDEDRGRLAVMTNVWLRWWENEGAAGRWKV